jgi:hypothetical protein
MPTVKGIVKKLNLDLDVSSTRLRHVLAVATNEQVRIQFFP